MYPFLNKQFLFIVVTYLSAMSINQLLFLSNTILV